MTDHDSKEPSHPATEQAFYVTKPTRWTVFLRTFLPWQLWRFVRINLKMIGIIRRSHGGHRGRGA